MDCESYRKPGGDWYLEEVSSDEGTGWLIPVDTLPFVIGRDEDCQLTLKSKWVSRHHAQIHAMEDTVWILDLDSTNGTFVNHKRIDQGEMLEPGDVVRFANSAFRINRAASGLPRAGGTTAAFDGGANSLCLPSFESALRELLAQRTVVPHFQPILSFFDLKVEGYEILGRIRREDLPSSPAELFEIASCLGCASELSAVFREEGLRAGKGLEGSPLFFVNSCPAELYRLDHLEKSLRIMHDIAPSCRVVLEISEKSVAGEGEFRKVQDILKNLEMGLAYDDFGVGQTRLVELAQAPPDFLKFDASIVRNIHLAPRRLHQMVLTFINAARELGISTIAEGIETSEEGSTCRQLGFEYVQGFLYGRPMPLDEVEVFGDPAGRA